jgi:hypothetical protein
MMDDVMLLLPADLSMRASRLTSDLGLHHGPLSVLQLDVSAVLSLAVFRGVERWKSINFMLPHWGRARVSPFARSLEAGQVAVSIHVPSWLLARVDEIAHYENLSRGGAPTDLETPLYALYKDLSRGDTLNYLIDLGIREMMYEIG